MIQGLFDDTEDDKSQSEKKSVAEKRNVFADDVLFEITKPNYRKPAAEEQSPHNAVNLNVAEPENAENYSSAAEEEAAGKADAAAQKMTFDAAVRTLEKEDAAEIAAATGRSSFDEIEFDEASSPLLRKSDVEEMILPPFAGSNEVTAEKKSLADETNAEEKPFAEPEINISFSDPHDTFLTAEPVIEKDKRDTPTLFQMQHTPELPEDTARKTGLALSAGIALFVAVVFMMIIGWFADLLLGSSPWGLVCGIVIGSIIGFYQFFKTTSQILK